MRVRFLCEDGFSRARFAELRIGPVPFREELKNLDEAARSHDRAIVSSRIAGFAPDGSRWRFRHEIGREDGA